ncbi:MAG: serine hydrolase domain-containing protein, partial [Gemmatimonadota bacterium]
TRYDPDTQEPIPFYRFDHDGASAVWSSAHDLIRFGLFHLGHLPDGAREILSPETRRRMQRSATPEGVDRGYGLGWSVEEDLGFRRVSHTGSMPGVSTMLALFPEEDAAVVVLMNTLARDLREVFQRRIAAALMPAYEEAWRREYRADTARAAADTAGGEAARAEGAGPGPAGSFDPPAELAGTWTGTLHTWQGEVPARLEVGEDGDVHARIDGQLETVVNGPEWEDGVFSGRMWGHVPTPDVTRHPRHRLELELLLEDGTLRGQLTAVTT